MSANKQQPILAPTVSSGSSVPVNRARSTQSSISGPASQPAAPHHEEEVQSPSPGVSVPELQLLCLKRSGKTATYINYLKQCTVSLSVRRFATLVAGPYDVKAAQAYLASAAKAQPTTVFWNMVLVHRDPRFIYVLLNRMMFRLVSVDEVMRPADTVKGIPAFYRMEHALHRAVRANLPKYLDFIKSKNGNAIVIDNDTIPQWQVANLLNCILYLSMVSFSAPAPIPFTHTQADVDAVYDMLMLQDEVMIGQVVKKYATPLFALMHRPSGTQHPNMLCAKVKAACEKKLLDLAVNMKFIVVRPT